MGFWTKARPELARLGIKVTEHVTTGAGEATEITRQALNGEFNHVVAVGGDGTLNEVVNGYLNEMGRAFNSSATLGLLPSGTGSDFGRTLGLRTHQDLISALARSNTRLVDAARIVLRQRDGTNCSRFFINAATLGLGADVAALVNQWREKLPKCVAGRIRYIAAAICALTRHRNLPVKVTLDDTLAMEINTNLLVIANGRFAGGGMMLAPNARLDDGLLDVILTDRITRRDVLKELPRIQQGGHLRNSKVTEMQAREVLITSSKPMAVAIDGETAGYTPAHLSILPSAVAFVGPDKI